MNRTVLLAFTVGSAGVPFATWLTGCEACDKTIEISGVVADAVTELPLGGVTVTFSYSSTETTTTDSNGVYSLTQDNFGGFAGGEVRFEKTGYATTYSEPMTEQEVGIERCGSYTIERDVMMTPQ